MKRDPILIMRRKRPPYRGLPAWTVTCSLCPHRAVYVAPWGPEYRAVTWVVDQARVHVFLEHSIAMAERIGRRYIP